MKTNEQAYEDLLFERDEIDSRILRLSNFIDDVHNISKLSLHQKILLSIQLQAMKTYKEILTARAADIKIYSSENSK